MAMSTVDMTSLVAFFSVTHIGLSAVREPIIERLGKLAGSGDLVGRGWSLPSFWLGDSSGLEVWPDEATAGRQLYRAAYTAVAGGSLFPALLQYPAVHAASADCLDLSSLDAGAWWALFAVAAGAQGISLASLANPSPLSLVPSFEGDEDAALGVSRRMLPVSPAASPARGRRDGA